MNIPFPLRSPGPLAPDERLSYAREVVRSEAAALEKAAERLDQGFLRAIDLILERKGRILVTGTGKSADVGQKIVGTLNSMGTRAYTLDVTRAVHGDLGMVDPDDVALVLSHSGESSEVIRLLTPLRPMVRGLIALTGNRTSTLARQADASIIYGPMAEVCPLGLAPSASTTTMLAIGDALAFVLSRIQGFRAEDFSRFHPAGSLGRNFLTVDAVMRHGPALRLASRLATVRQVFGQVRRRGRRTGAVMLLDEARVLCGLFTDSDLARLIEEHREQALDRPIHEVMTPSPLYVRQGSRLVDAVDILSTRKISELPVVDEKGHPVGLIDITDLVGIISLEEADVDEEVQAA